MSHTRSFRSTYTSIASEIGRKAEREKERGVRKRDVKKRGGKEKGEGGGRTRGTVCVRPIKEGM